MHDGGVFRRAALRHGDEGPRAQPAQAAHVEFLELPSPAARDLAQALAIFRRRQFVGRQGRQCSGERIGLGHGGDLGEAGGIARAVEVNPRQRPGFGLLPARRQAHAVQPGHVERLAGVLAPHLGAAEQAQHQLTRLLLHERRHGLAQHALPIEGAPAAVEHDETAQAAAGKIDGDRRLGQVLGLHVAALQGGAQAIEAGNIAQAVEFFGERQHQDGVGRPLEGRLAERRGGLSQFGQHVRFL